MCAKTTCIGHENGFEHIDLDLDGIEEGFDFGLKFIEDPTFADADDTSEPHLSMYISVYHPEYFPYRDKSLQYSLVRSKWVNSPRCTEIDKKNLFRLSITLIRKEIESIIKGNYSDSLGKNVFV